MIKTQEQLTNDWHFAIGHWRNSLGEQEVYTDEELETTADLYNPSFDVQLQLDKIFAQLVKLSQVKTGDYSLATEEIFPYKSYNQSRNYESRLFGTELKLGTNADQFFIQSSLSNAENIWAQHDDWWSNLFKLVNEHEFYFYEGIAYQESGKRNVSNLFKRLTEFASEPLAYPDVGWLFITWGNIFDLESSIDEGVKIFKRLHKINHGLYRTKYTRNAQKAC